MKLVKNLFLIFCFFYLINCTLNIRMNKIKDKIDPIEYISLKDASKLCSYSQDYLSLRARQGKLKAVKVGRNWMTTKEWLKSIH